MRQQAQLQLVCHLHVAFQSPLLSRDFFIQASILNGDGDLGRQRSHGTLVIFGEEPTFRMLQIEHADDFVFVDQRRGQSEQVSGFVMI